MIRRVRSFDARPAYPPPPSALFAEAPAVLGDQLEGSLVRRSRPAAAQINDVLLQQGDKKLAILEGRFPEVDTATTLDRARALIARVADEGQAFPETLRNAVRVLLAPSVSVQMDVGRPLKDNEPAVFHQAKFRTLELLDRVLQAREAYQGADAHLFDHGLVCALAKGISPANHRWCAKTHGMNLLDACSGFVPELTDRDEAPPRPQWQRLLRDCLANPAVHLDLPEDVGNDQLFKAMSARAEEIYGLGAPECAAIRKDLISFIRFDDERWTPPALN
jgi:hypothetical protein